MNATNPLHTFAAAALQGLLASYPVREGPGLDYNWAAKEAVAYAGALMEALGEDKTTSTDKAIVEARLAAASDKRSYCAVIESEWVKTSRGGYLELTLAVLQGPGTGLHLRHHLYLQDGNKTVQGQAYRHLAVYCHLTGQIQITDSSQLHGIPFWVRFAGVDEEEDSVVLLAEGAPPSKTPDSVFTVKVLEA